MFEPVRPAAPIPVPETAGCETRILPRISSTELQQTVRDASLVERPQIALEVVDGMDAAALQALASTDTGRDALDALDAALADAPDPLGEIGPQRARIAAAREDDGSDGSGVPAGGAACTTRTTARIGDNTVTWTNDADGRPLRAEADLSEVFRDIDRSSAETRAQSESADRGIDGDQGGHVIGHRFVKDQGLKNLFPQNGNFNVSAYKTLENEWADWIDSGHEVHIDVSLSPQLQDRPDTVRVSYEVIEPATGRVVHDQTVTFENTAGQTYDRVSRTDMTLAAPVPA